MFIEQPSLAIAMDFSPDLMSSPFNDSAKALSVQIETIFVMEEEAFKRLKDKAGAEPVIAEAAKKDTPDTPIKKRSHFAKPDQDEETKLAKSDAKRNILPELEETVKTSPVILTEEAVANTTF